MIEAVPFIFLFIIAVAAYAAARLHVPNPVNHCAQEEITRLQQQRAWLEERLQQSWRENWDQAMRFRIADELEATETQLESARSTPSN